MKVETFTKLDAKSYYRELEKWLRLTGAGWEYFAERRVKWTYRCVTKLGCMPTRILDYGCGPGDTLPILANQFKGTEVVGCDLSCSLLSEAKQRHPGFKFIQPSELIEAGQFDMIYMNGVLHHIQPTERLAILSTLKQRLKPGAFLAIWENNPWNPGTRFIMRRVSFDRSNSWPLSPIEVTRLCEAAGLLICRIDFQFFFPGRLKAFSILEKCLCKLPLGGQYLTLARTGSE